MLEVFNSVNVRELKEAMEGLGTVSLILRDGTKEMKVMVEETKKGLREAATMAPRTLCQQCNQNLGQGTAQKPKSRRHYPRHDTQRLRRSPIYATVKNMDELRQVEDVCMEKLRRWRDAIIDAQQIGLIVPFAEAHLT
ncbi:hypothetical protein V6N11_045906 [Hibiscus sabdariffa]|uniref:Uncharacterized protein n=1 Tax=Hibiscus sabdariffa TaxID=183260 RepID=A0ABR2Q2C1_9ROSI